MKEKELNEMLAYACIILAEEVKVKEHCIDEYGEFDIYKKVMTSKEWHDFLMKNYKCKNFNYKMQK